MSLPLGMNADPAAIERDIDQTRARVDRVLDALQSRLSPRQLRAQARLYLQDRSVRAVNRVSRSVRDNPVPVVIGVLVTVGWIILVRRHRRRLESKSARRLHHWP